LRIIEEYVLDKNRTIELEILENMLIVSAPAPVVLEQTIMLKSIVPDPG